MKKTSTAPSATGGNWVNDQPATFAVATTSAVGAGPGGNHAMMKYALATTTSNICNERKPPTRSAMRPPTGRNAEPPNTTKAAMSPAATPEAEYHVVK